MILRREPDGFSAVAREWEGEAVAILGGGPSLSAEQIDLVRGAHVAGRLRCIAVNDAYLVAPWADVCYFADSHWWRWHSQGIYKPGLGLSAAQVRERFAAFAGEKCTIQGSGNDVSPRDAHRLRNADYPRHGYGLSLNPRAITTGSNGGWQACNVAILSGVATALLLGFDGTPDAEGQTHWHGGHPVQTAGLAYRRYRESFDAAAQAIRAAGVRVINCNPASQIDAFEKMTAAAALKLNSTSGAHA